MRIDLHVHAKERSMCSLAGEDDMIKGAIAAGMDAIALTDHDRLVPKQQLEALNAKYAPFKVFTGIEVTVGSEHILVLGVHDPALERFGWAYADLHRFVKEHDGVMIVAHPYRFQDKVDLPIDEFPPDAVEVHSTNTGLDDELMICALADRLNCRMVCTSDAHVPTFVGAYHLVFRQVPNTDAELVAELKTGTYEFGKLAPRIQSINASVEKNEAEIQRLIEAGYDRAAYRRLTGKWEGYFDRVAAGKSYRI